MGDDKLRGSDPLQQGCCDDRRDQHKGCHEPLLSAKYRQAVIPHAAPKSMHLRASLAVHMAKVGGEKAGSSSTDA